MRRVVGGRKEREKIAHTTLLTHPILCLVHPTFNLVDEMGQFSAYFLFPEPF